MPMASTDSSSPPRSCGSTRMVKAAQILRRPCFGRTNCATAYAPAQRDRQTCLRCESAAYIALLRHRVGRALGPRPQTPIPQRSCFPAGASPLRGTMLRAALSAAHFRQERPPAPEVDKGFRSHRRGAADPARGPRNGPRRPTLSLLYSKVAASGSPTITPAPADHPDRLPVPS